MKGPAGRIQLDVRRHWKCPECGTEIKMAGDIVQKVCKCQKEGHWMKLISETQQKGIMSSIQKMKELENFDPTAKFLIQPESEEQKEEA